MQWQSNGDREMSKQLTHLSLFSGIGGLDLAAEWSGFVTVGQCEMADYPTMVLEKHWPDVPRWRDIRTLTKDSFYERTGLRTVDIISGGFPCQPFSNAGKRGGTEDDRYLWPEMLRVIQELQPTWVIGENVPGIVNMALDQVLTSLEEAGYETQTFIVPAASVNAWHKRERVCIVAYSDSKRNGVGRSQEDASEMCGQGTADIGGETQDDMWFRWFDQPGMGRMVSRLQQSMDWPDTDTENSDCERSKSHKICGGGRYKHRLEELIETSPGGIIGRVNPEWIEWLMGYPIGWTELNV